MALPEVLESVARKVAEAATGTGIQLGGKGYAVATQRLLDRFENEFYENMLAAIERRGGGR